MEDKYRSPLWVRIATTSFALALALGINAVGAYAIGQSGTPNGYARHVLVADLGTAPTITVRACKAG